MEIARCGSCNSDIVWVRTQGSKRMPLDAKPVSGLFVVLDDPEGPKAISAREVYKSHFATCPDADKWRK